MPKHENKASAITRLAVHARDAADASDRWFVGLASEIGDVGAWAHSEAHGVAQSLSAAVTSAIAARKDTAPTKPTETPSREVATCRVTSEPEDSQIATSTLVGPADSSSSNLALLSASADLTHSRRASDEDDAAEARATHSPGVLPVLDALERVVGEHVGSPRRSLDRDARFWKLIELLQLLKRPEQQRDPELDDSSAPSTGER
jgi:hypothetical protein